MRWRVTVAFGTVLVTVSTVVGLMVVLWFRHDLVSAVDAALRVRVDALAAAQEGTSSVLPLGGTVGEFDESPTQVLDAQGRVLASSAGLRVALLGEDQARRALSGPLLADRRGDSRLDESLRLLARAVRLPDGRELVVVVASSRDELDERLHSLVIIGTVGLVAALVLSGAGGYLASGVALRPVEAMRRDAEAVDTAGHGRLSVPPVDDEVGRLGRTLNAMLDRVHAARAVELASLGREQRFVTDASHELRGPLTTLRTEIELAVGDPHPTTVSLRATLVSAGEEVLRLSSLTDDLLTLARTQATGSRLERIDLAALVDSVADGCLDTARDAGRALTVHYPDPCVVSVDALLVAGAVRNLVDNALRHGAGPVRIIVGLDGAALVVAVEDSGPGFDEAFRPHAADRFSRADAARHGPGAGLGLAIADAVARAHGGELRVENTTHGPRVALVIPASDA